MKKVSRGRETRDRRSFRRQSRRFLVSTLTPRHSPRYATLSRFISSSLGSSLRSGTRHEGTLLASVWSLTAPFPRYARHSLRPYVSDGPSTRPDPTLIPALFPRFTRPLVGPVASRAPCRAGPSSREPATAARLHLPRSARRVGGTCGGRNESVTRPFAARDATEPGRRNPACLTSFVTLGFFFTRILPVSSPSSATSVPTAFGLPTPYHPARLIRPHFVPSLHPPGVVNGSASTAVPSSLSRVPSPLRYAALYPPHPSLRSPSTAPRASPTLPTGRVTPSSFHVPSLLSSGAGLRAPVPCRRGAFSLRSRTALPLPAFTSPFGRRDRRASGGV